MKNNGKILVLIFVSLLLCSCDFFDETPQTGVINLQNNTESAIYVYVTYKDTLPKSPKLNLFDTITIEKSYQKKDSIISPVYRLNAYSYYVDFEKNDGGIIFNDYSAKSVDKKVRLYFIKESTMRTKTWDEIYKGQLYEKKMIFTEDELTELNWEVNYE